MSSSNVFELDSTAFPCPAGRPSPDCKYVSCAMPATGNPLGLVKGNCASLEAMEKDLAKTGGTPTGRGVTPCPFGYIQACTNGNCTYQPYKEKTIQRTFGAIFPEFAQQWPTFVPRPEPTRALYRVGNVWTNGGSC